MTLTHNIYEDLSESLKKGNFKTLSKQYTTPNGHSLIYAMDCDTGERSLYFIADEIAIDSMPQCKGLSVAKTCLYKYSSTDYFCQLSENSSGESYIFEIIIEDIRRNIDELPDNKKMAPTVSSLLIKWKSFFAQEKQVVMSSERQQGLYGELLFLNQLIDIQGASAISWWTGCDYETHDFYIRGNAVEIKTTSLKAPYKMHISSEYQLDDSEISGFLMVEFFALRKSAAEGVTLPNLINEIRIKSKDEHLMRKKFDQNLEAYGYFDGLEDKYSTGYFIREEHAFYVRDGFPRIIKNDLEMGVSSCTYDVLISHCAAYEISSDEKLSKLKGSEIIG